MSLTGLDNPKDADKDSSELTPGSPQTLSHSGFSSPRAINYSSDLTKILVKKDMSDGKVLESLEPQDFLGKLRGLGHFFFYLEHKSVPGQPGLCSETMSCKQTNKQTQNSTMIKEN